MTGRVTPHQLAEALGLPPPTDEQAAVIAAPPGPTLVVAGAGAGKTETMAARVVWMVANRLVLPEQVLGLTFTRKAAQQLTARIRTRLARLAGAPLLRELDPSGQLRAQLTGSEPEISTYHSYAGRLLGEHGLLLPVEPSATLLSETQLWQLAHRVVRDWDGDLDTERTPVSVTEAVLALSGQLAEHLLEPEQLVEAHTELEKLVHTLPAGPRQRGGPSQTLLNILRVQRERVALLPLVQQLAETLRRRGALDFGAQMSLAARLAAEHPEVAVAERARFRLVLLDEYQDTGHAQRILLAALFGGADLPAASDTATGPDRGASAWREPGDGDVTDSGSYSGRDVSIARAVGNGDPRPTGFRSGPSGGVWDDVPVTGTAVPDDFGGGPTYGGPVVAASADDLEAESLFQQAFSNPPADELAAVSESAGPSPVSPVDTARRPPPVASRQRLAVTAVGDPMQSIYGWRGASAANLPRFATDFPAAPGVPAPTLSLLTSWRNPPEALALANLVSAPLRRHAIDVGGVTVDALRAKPGAGPGVVAVALTDTVAAERAWVAERIAAEWASRKAAGQPPPTSAVLVRRNADAAPLAEALREQGLPVEIVGLGGLLATPEVADVVATLRLIAEPGTGSAAMRVLTGARWRVGVADIAALARRARELSIGRTGQQNAGEIADPAALDAALRDVAPEPAEQAGLADAIADPGPPERYSASGFARIQALGRELAALRERSGQPLTELVADVERTIGVAVETQARRAMVGAGAGREHLDAFAEVVAGYAADSGASLNGLLAFLAAAEDVENGLEPGEVEVAADRVQVLTVHAAKGLEWEVVAVVHVVAGVFPSKAGSGTWLGALAELPTTLRGDRRQHDAAEGVPVLELADLNDRAELERAIKAHKEALERRRIDEERRLFYVAVTRTERVLLVSAHHWAETGAEPKGPSEFLTELKSASEDLDGPAAGALRVDRWDDPPAPDAANPFTDEPAVAQWPRDPLGARRASIEEGASLVRAALAELHATASVTSSSTATRDSGADQVEPGPGATEELRLDPARADELDPDDHLPDSTSEFAEDPSVTFLSDPMDEFAPDEFPPDPINEFPPDEYIPDFAAEEFIDPYGDIEPDYGDAAPPDPMVEYLSAEDRAFVAAFDTPLPHPAEDPDDPEGWAADVDALLAEHHAAATVAELVELPGQLAATALVELRADPGRLAARLRRPLPYPPNPLARRGTAFHAWVQSWFGADRLLEVDELPGAADGAGAAGPDAELAAMQDAFRRSPWAARSPIEVEIPFETSLAGTVIRGRMDAVFTEPDGGWVVVDWKTGAEPTPAEEPAVAIQLAVYRLAWARLMAAREGRSEQEMLARTGAAFHYVRTGRTIAPATPAGPAELAELIRSVEPPPAPG